MRILPVVTLLLATTLNPVPRPPAPAPVAHHLPAFAEAYHESAAQMLASGGPYAMWAVQGRHFLFFDPAGDGRAAEVFGDLSTASHIAVLVPGVGTTLSNFERGLGGVARRAPGVQGQTLYEQLSKRSNDTAVISWFGYDTPDGIDLAAATEGRARTGAAALATFVHDVLAQRPDATVSLIGHSYGSMVVGMAARHLPEVHDLITLGSPGLGVNHASDLGGATVWAAQAPADWIRRIPQVRILGLGLGKRPTAAGFGAHLLPTDGVAGHDYYLVPGSATLRAVTDIVLSGGPRHDVPARVS
jgi:pimeloyl-ACP methyl ester carboxylesterase